MKHNKYLQCKNHRKTLLSQPHCLLLERLNITLSKLICAGYIAFATITMYNSSHGRIRR